MNIADESFPDIIITDSSSSEDDVKDMRASSLMGGRTYKSTSDVSKVTTTEENLKSRSKSTNELVGRRNSQYRDVPSKVRQYISSLPQPRGPVKRLVKQQTLPEKLWTHKQESHTEALHENLHEIERKYEKTCEKLEEVLDTNHQLTRKIEQMQCEMEAMKNSQAPAVLIPSETVHMQEPENGGGIRKRFVEHPAESENSLETSSQSSLFKRRGKRHKIRKVMKKLVCCTGSDSVSIYDGYMELPAAARDSAYYSPTQVAY